MPRIPLRKIGAQSAATIRVIRWRSDENAVTAEKALASAIDIFDDKLGRPWDFQKFLINRHKNASTVAYLRQNRP